MRKLIPLLLAITIFVGCSQAPTRDNATSNADFVLLADSTEERIVFPEVTWGMSQKDALKALNLTKSMLTEAVYTDAAVGTDQVYTVEHDVTGSVPSIRSVTFAKDDDMVKQNGLIGITVGYTDKADLDKAIANFSALYGDANMQESQDENGNPDGNLLGGWSGKQTVVAALGDKGDDFAAELTKATKSKSDNLGEISDMPISAFANTGTTSAQVTSFDKPNEDGLVGFIQLYGLWDARINQFLSK